MHPILRKFQYMDEAQEIEIDPKFSEVFQEEFIRHMRENGWRFNGKRLLSHNRSETTESGDQIFEY